MLGREVAVAREASPSVVVARGWIHAAHASGKVTGAIVAAFFGVKNQASVATSTSDYETMSLAEAEARAAAERSTKEGAYSTVFEKWQAKREGKLQEENTEANADINFLPPLIMVAGILALNVVGKQ